MKDQKSEDERNNLDNVDIEVGSGREKKGKDREAKERRGWGGGEENKLAFIYK